MENLLREKRMENLSLVSRYLRLSNPYDKKEVKNYLWDLEAQFNIPLLLLYSEYLHIYCQKHDYHKLLMCTRDCSKFHKLFKRLYPQYEVIYFHASRDAYHKASEDYIRYIKSLITPKTMIIDLVGTGRSGDKIFGNVGYPKRFYFWGYPDVNNGNKENKEFLDRGTGEFSTIEILNSDSIGCLIDVIYKDGQYIDFRRDVTHDITLLDFVDDMIEKYFQHQDIFNFNNDTTVNTNLKSELIKQLISEFRRELNKHAVKLDNIFKHNEENKKNLESKKYTILELANKYGSDKGDQNFHKHQYSRVYDKILLPLKYQKLKILEIGLSISSVKGESTSINIWYDYFPHGKIYGYDIRDFKRYENNRINIFQGDQSKEEDLNKFIELYGTDFDIIIDDGYHTSLCQQQSMKILFTKCLKSDGIYILEDLHFRPEPEPKGILRTKDYLRNLNNKINFEYEFMGAYHKQIYDNIKSLEFYDTLTPERTFSVEDKKDALCVIYKK